MPDSDAYGVGAFNDNCIVVPNADQRDTDGDSDGIFVDANFSQDQLVDYIDLAFLHALIGLPPGAYAIDNLPAAMTNLGNAITDRFDVGLLTPVVGTEDPVADTIVYGLLPASGEQDHVGTSQLSLVKPDVTPLALDAPHDMYLELLVIATDTVGQFEAVF